MSTSPCLLEALAQSPDPRKKRGVRHPLPAILALTVLAMLPGAKSYEASAQFGRDHGPARPHARGFRRGKTPAKSTCAIWFRVLEIQALEAALARWIAGRLSPEQVLTLALDGTTARGSKDGDVPGQHLVAADAPDAQAVLAQVKVDAKTNEHQAALELLGILPVQGRSITGDAIVCQRDLCREVIDAGGDQVFTVKDNQPNLASDLAAELAYEEQSRR